MPTADVTLPARVDVTTSGDVRYALQIAIDASVDEDVVVDCRRLDLVDVAGLGVLVGAHRRARTAGRRLVFADPPPRIVRLLAVTRLHRILTVERTTPQVGPPAAPGGPLPGPGPRPVAAAG